MLAPDSKHELLYSPCQCHGSHELVLQYLQSKFDTELATVLIESQPALFSPNELTARPHITKRPTKQY